MISQEAIMKQMASPGSMHNTGCLGLVHWDDPEGWCGEGGGRRVQDGEGLILKLKLQYFGHLMRRADSGKDPDAGKDRGQEEMGTTEDKMVGWHRRLNGHGFGWILGVGDEQ